MSKHLNAFTYLETLITLLIIIVLINAIHFTKFNFNEADEEEINDEFIAILNYYQTLAIIENKVITAQFQLGGDLIKFKSNGQPVGEYHLKHVMFYESSTNTPEIFFRPTGVNQGATIIYKMNETYYKLIIQLYRGRIRIEKM